MDILLEINYDKYAPFVHNTKKGKILCIRIAKMLHGILKSSLLYYKKFVKDIKQIGCQINPCETYVANKMINNKQHTLAWHVDDIKASHVNPTVNDKFAEWCESIYGSKELGSIKVKRSTRILRNEVRLL